MRVLSEGLPGKVFYGWWIVAVLLLVEFVGAGGGLFTFGLYIKPMSEELGWSRTLIVTAVTVRTVITFLFAPIIGVFLDRYGPRVIMSIGALIGGAALISLGSVHSLWHWYLAYGVGGALGLGLTGGLVIQTTVAKWFVRRRGLAMAITSSGFGFGGMVTAPITQVIISTVGWRTAWVIFGLIMCIFASPASALVLRRTPEDLGMLPDGAPAGITPADAGGSHGRASRWEEVSWTPAEAIKTRTLWLMTAAVSLNILALSAVLTNQAAYVTDRGLSDAMAAAVVTMVSGLLAVANLVWGLLAERFPVRNLVVLSFLIASVGLSILTTATSLPIFVLYAVIFGSRDGAVLSGLVYADYWGREYLGAIRGYVTPFQTAASAAGPLLAALVFDRRGSYAAAFGAAAAFFLVAALVMASAAPPKKRMAVPGSARGPST